MRPLVVDHVAILCRSEVALDALQKLVSPASCRVEHKALTEAHMGRVLAKFVSNTALGDCFFEGTLRAGRTHAAIFAKTSFLRHGGLGV